MHAYMVEKEFGERNFDSLKSRLNRDMEEEGIVAGADSWSSAELSSVSFWTPARAAPAPELPPAPGAVLPGQLTPSGSPQTTTIPFSSMSQFILDFRLIDCGSGRTRDVGEPDAVIKIHNIIRRRTRLLAVILYYRYIDIYIVYYLILFRYRAPGLPPELPECSRDIL